MTAREKPTRKPKGLPLHLRPGNTGNSGGKKGRSGRKRLPFVARCDALADGVVLTKIIAQLKATNPTDPAWRWCAEYVLKYSKAEPKKGVELTGKDGASLIPIEAIQDAIRRVSASD